MAYSIGFSFSPRRATPEGEAEPTATPTPTPAQPQTPPPGDAR
jgi:hypothetical protein